MKKRECIDLFWSFFKIGCVLFGGGYTVLPLLQREFSEKRSFATNEELADYFALSQCTPGIIAVNVAVYIGYKRQKAPGALFSALGIILPSFIIITLISSLIFRFSDIPVVAHTFAGLRIAVCVIILNAVIKLIKSGAKNIFYFIVFGISFLAVIIFNISPVFIILSGGILGVIFYFRRDKQ